MIELLRWEAAHNDGATVSNIAPVDGRSALAPLAPYALEEGMISRQRALSLELT